MITARLLSFEWRRRLVQSLRIELSCTVDHPDRQTWPAGAVSYEARFVVSWDADTAQAADVVDARLLTELGGGAQRDEIDYLNIEIGHAVFLICDLMAPTLTEALDARSEELLHMAETLLDSRTCDLTADLEEQLEGVGSGLLIVDDIDVYHSWRGLGLGLLGTGLALRHLQRGCTLAAVYPIQPRGETRDPSQYWGQLGFRPYRNQILILDLALITLNEALERRLLHPVE